MSGDAKIKLYGNASCGYCAAARMLLKKNGLDYEDIPVSDDEQAYAEMRERSGSTSVPQIFINDQAIGGFNELYELAESGELDELIGTQEI